MAQWLGQFTGRTHRTAALEAERLLRHAIDVLQAADDAERPEKLKIVRSLAKRLYSARTHFLKARIKEAKRAAIGATKRIDPRELARLEDELVALAGAGVAGILAELLPNEGPVAQAVRTK